MKKVIFALALVISFISNAQVVYTDELVPWTLMDDGNMLVDRTNASTVFYDFGSVENYLQFMENIKNGVSTEMYTVTPYALGTMKVTFNDQWVLDKFVINKTEYYITPYLRKEITKAIKVNLTYQR